jgi:hypothetical protein
MVKWVEKSANKGVTLQEDFTSTTESTQVMLAETELFDEKQQLFDLMFQKLGDKWKFYSWVFFTIYGRSGSKLNVTYGYVRKKKSLYRTALSGFKKPIALNH